MATSYRYQSRLDLACEPSAVQYARQHATDVAAQWGLPRDVVGDAALIVDELVANAVRHAGGTAEPFDPAHGQPKVRRCSLTMWIAAHHLVVTVYDQSRSIPVLRPPSVEAEDGRGLHLVAGLTDGKWGFQVAVDHPGKLVWAKLRIPSRSSPLKGAAGGHSNAKRARFAQRSGQITQVAPPSPDPHGTPGRHTPDPKQKRHPQHAGAAPRTLSARYGSTR